MKKAVLGIVLATAIIAVAILLREETEATPAAAGAPTAPGKTGKASSEAVLSIAPGMKRESTRTTGVSKVSPLMQEFFVSREHKALYDRLKAKANPTGEELWIMARILEVCAKVTEDKIFADAPRWGDTLGTPEAKERFTASLSPKAPNRDKRIAAFEAMNVDPCKAFGELKTTRAELKAAYERAALAGDPKGRIDLLQTQLNEQNLKPNGDINWNQRPVLTEAQLATWREVVASGDPRALTDAMSVIQRATNYHLQAPDESSIDASSLYYAAMLASCQLGRDCSRDSPYLQQSCALEGACDVTDLRDYLLFYSTSPSRSQQVVQYEAALLRWIRDGDASFFTVVPGPSPAQAPFQRP